MNISLVNLSSAVSDALKSVLGTSEYSMQVQVELFQQDKGHERKNNDNRTVIAQGTTDVSLQAGCKSPGHAAAGAGFVGNGFVNTEIMAEIKALRWNGNQAYRKCQDSRPKGQKECKLPIACRADSLVHL
ncbi:MAG: hypothetical protein PHY48_10105 [Candidatus Cloacimonetes bacterium]|nr:hypothetical protein [Candidatus Cloacimonadota bacterium]